MNVSFSDILFGAGLVSILFVFYLKGQVPSKIEHFDFCSFGSKKLFCNCTRCFITNKSNFVQKKLEIRIFVNFANDVIVEQPFG